MLISGPEPIRTTLSPWVSRREGRRQDAEGGGIVPVHRDVEREEPLGRQPRTPDQPNGDGGGGWGVGGGVGVEGGEGAEVGSWCVPAAPADHQPGDPGDGSGWGAVVILC